MMSINSKRNIVVLFFKIFDIMCVSIPKEEGKWLEIKNYNSMIYIRESKIGPGFPIDIISIDMEIRKQELQELIEARANDDIINGYEYFALYKYLRKHVFYTMPEIKKVIKVNYIKRYSLYYIEDGLRPIDSNPPMVFAVRRDGNEIHRFGRAEFEVEPLILHQIKKSDIRFFNKIMERESVKVEDPAFALDICMLFIKMAYYIKDEVVKSPIEIEELFEKRYGEMGKKELNKLKRPLHAPLFIKEKNKYKLKFFTCYGTIEEWHFEVSKKGKIRLINLIDVY